MSSYSGITQTAKMVADVVKRTFGDESGVQVSDTDIYRWINMAQRELLNTNPVNKAVGDTVLNVDQSDYSVIALRILRIQSIHIGGKKIDYKSFQEAEEYVMKQDPLKTSRGTPRIWYEWAGTIKLWPLPDTANTMRIYYVKDFTPVAADADLLSVPDTYFNRIVEFVLSQAYEMDEDSQNAQFKLSQFTGGLQTMSESENAPEMDTYPVITILEEDDWY